MRTLETHATFDPIRRELHDTIRVRVIASGAAMRAGLRALVDSGPGLVLAGHHENVDDCGQEGDVFLCEAGPDIEPDDIPGPAVILAESLGSPGAGWGYRFARGWLRRDAPAAQVTAAIHAVAAGLDVRPGGSASVSLPEGAWGMGFDSAAPETLTPREREVLDLVALGLPNKGIALRLGISEHTAKFHVGSVLARLGAASRAEAVAIAVRRGMLTL